MIRTFFAVALGLVLFTVPVFAGDQADNEVLIGKTIAGSVAAKGPVQRDFSQRALRGSRGPALPALYGMLAGLNAYDGWSTVKAVRLGAIEGNPAVAGIASNAPAMWAVKTGATLASVYAAERLWRRNRKKEAIITMVAVNGVMAMVAARNASVLRGMK
jgi:hypothetical protein